MQHIPVLVNEIKSQMPEFIDYYVDGTVGHGGHTKLLCENRSIKNIYCIDRDAAMLKIAKNNLEGIPNISFFQGSYVNVKTYLGIQKADFILLDLGTNWEHVTDHNRGFSMFSKQTIDMRFDTNQTENALNIIRTHSKENWIHNLEKYGDIQGILLERCIDSIHSFNKKQLTTCRELTNELFTHKVPKVKVSVLFQVIRIVVNKELEQVEQFLEILPDIMNKNGRCCIISFHSIEDRIIKYGFKKLVEKGGFTLVHKKAIKPHYKEVQKNKASRSSVLRTIEKI